MKYPLFSRTSLASGFGYLLAVLLLILAYPVSAGEVSNPKQGDVDSSITSFCDIVWGGECKIKAEDFTGHEQDVASKAEQGDAKAQFFLGYMYDFGKGFPKDAVEGAKWIRKAAEQALPEAQYCLGVMYDFGCGVPEDRVEAAKWYRKAAEQEYAPAQFQLGDRYRTGQGVAKNYAEAAKWIRKAAEQGDALAQYGLSLMYGSGDGVPKNRAEGMKWLRKAAEQGLDIAQENLGQMYYSGNGVPKDYAEAMKWLLKVAEDGWPSTQREVGIMYAEGLSVPQNYVQAYFWANLAAAEGDKDAISLRDSLSRLMTPAQIAKAQEMSANWRPKSSATSDESKQPPSQSKQRSTQPEEELQLIAGTGFVVSLEGHVLTNYHVVEGCAKIACDLNGKAVVLSLAQTDARNDLALLKLKEPGPIPLKFREGKSIRSGDGVVVVGYPLQDLLANQAHVTTGTVSAMAGPGNDTRILEITAPVQPGDSGGPLLDMAGNVVGVVTAKLDAIKTAQLTGDLPQNVNFAINAAVVRAFLDADGLDYETSNSTRKLEASEIGDLAKKATFPIVCSK